MQIIMKFLQVFWGWVWKSKRVEWAWVLPL